MQKEFQFKARIGSLRTSQSGSKLTRARLDSPPRLRRSLNNPHKCLLLPCERDSRLVR